MGPAELYDACDAAIAGRPRWRGRRRPVLWLTSPAVTVGARTWGARHRQPDGTHGYTVAQCRAIGAALLPVLAAYSGAAERAAVRQQMLR
jgi:hypothetical protein